MRVPCPSLLALLAALLATLTHAQTSSLPVLIWHGMGDNCCNPWSMGYVKKMLEQQIGGGVYVRSLEIGDSIAADTENGFFMDVNKQVEMVCKDIAEDEKLKDGYNAVGFSQGGQFLRAVAQRCPQGMKNLVTFGGQHQGVYGLPRCLGENHTLCDYARRLLNYGAYVSWIQNFLVQAQYWHDPLDEAKYRAKSVFLADINNERDVNKEYVENLQKLDKFVMVKFTEDSIVDPRGTEWFGWYSEDAPGQTMVSLNETRLYKEDRLGLRSMMEKGQLVFLESPGNHLQFTEQFLKEEIVDKYLK